MVTSKIANVENIGVATHPSDAFNEALDKRLPINVVLQQLTGSGISPAQLAQTFANRGFSPTLVAGLLGVSHGVLGSSDFISQYAKQLDSHEQAEFEKARTGRERQSFEALEKAMYTRVLATEEHSKKMAEHYASMGTAEAGHLLGSMLSPGHDGFWDQMANSGHISHDLANTAKQLSHNMPAEIDRQKSQMSEDVHEDKDISNEQKKKADDFLKTKEGEEIAKKKAELENLRKLREKAEQEQAAGRDNSKIIQQIDAQQAQLQADLKSAAKINAENGDIGIAAAIDKKTADEYKNKSSAELQSLRKAEASAPWATENQKMAADVLGASKEAVVAQLDKGGEALKKDAVKSMLGGTHESASKSLSYMASQGLASGAIKSEDLKKGETTVGLTEIKKEAPVAAKGSSDLKSATSEDDDMFGAAPPLASKLAQMRGQNEEASPALAKKASMAA